MGQRMGVKFAEAINVFLKTRDATVIAQIRVIAGEQPTDATNAITMSVSTVTHIVKLSVGMIQTARTLLMAVNIVINQEIGVCPTCRIAGNIVHLMENAKELEMAVLYAIQRSDNVLTAFLNVVTHATMMMTVKVATMVVYIVTKAAAHPRKPDLNAKTAVLLMTIALELQKVAHVA
jgi:hypothetical protein